MEPPAYQPSLSRGAVYGILSAALFGVSAPVAKLLLPGAPPVQLAALFYLGAGVGLTLISIRPRSRDRGTKIPFGGRRDWQLLAGIVLAGGMAGPVLMLSGLRVVSGVAGSLLLNLESVFTMLLAVTFFGDSLHYREASGAAIILVGAFLLSFDPSGVWAARPIGVALVGLACLAWGLDNNLTQRLSHRDPIRLVQVKTLSAGTMNLVLSFAMGQTIHWRLVPAALVLGFFCYGLSIVFDVLALRYLGAAREAAFFATAPFIGALAAIPILGESFGWRESGASALMVVGLVVMVTGYRGAKSPPPEAAGSI